MLIFFTLLLAILLLIALNPLLIMNGLAFSKRVKRFKDLPYAGDSRHKLDLYVPDHVDNSKPIIVFVYGGAWDSGHKNDYQFAGIEFAKSGSVTAIPNYRLYPDVKFPHFVEDVASACGALHKHLSNLNIVQKNNKHLPVNVVLIGHSAGAHTVAMLNSQPKYFKQAGANINIKACIGMAGPYDLPLDDHLVVGKFDGIELHDISDQHIDQGHQHNRHDANPINLARPGMSKMLLMHGRADTTVGLYHLEGFAKRLKELEVEFEVIIYQKVPHRNMVAGISRLFQRVNPVYKDLLKYLDKIH
jgi:acetyl esterase/lipase